MLGRICGRMRKTSYYAFCQGKSVNDAKLVALRTCGTCISKVGMRKWRMEKEEMVFPALLVGSLVPKYTIGCTCGSLQKPVTCCEGKLSNDA